MLGNVEGVLTCSSRDRHSLLDYIRLVYKQIVCNHPVAMGRLCRNGSVTPQHIKCILKPIGVVQSIFLQQSAFVRDVPIRGYK